MWAKESSKEMKTRKKNQNIICLDEYEEPAACDEYNLELKEALAALVEKYRIIMILFYSEGYRIREISDILKIPESTVKTRLQRGREKLEAYYKEKWGEIHVKKSEWNFK